MSVQDYSRRGDAQLPEHHVALVHQVAVLITKSQAGHTHMECMKKESYNIQDFLKKNCRVMMFHCKGELGDK